MGRFHLSTLAPVTLAGRLVLIASVLVGNTACDKSKETEDQRGPIEHVECPDCSPPVPAPPSFQTECRYPNTREDGLGVFVRLRTGEMGTKVLLIRGSKAFGYEALEIDWPVDAVRPFKAVDFQLSSELGLVSAKKALAHVRRLLDDSESSEDSLAFRNDLEAAMSRLPNNGVVLAKPTLVYDVRKGRTVSMGLLSDLTSLIVINPERETVHWFEVVGTEPERLKVSADSVDCPTTN